MGENMSVPNFLKDKQKSFEKNINSKKPLQKKIALQNKLINLFKERQVSHSIDGINIDSGYWKISFKRCMWNENNEETKQTNWDDRCSGCIVSIRDAKCASRR